MEKFVVTGEVFPVFPFLRRVELEVGSDIGASGTMY